MRKILTIMLVFLTVMLPTALSMMAGNFSFAETEASSHTQATNDIWNVDRIPTDDWDEFFLFYQRFLRERLPRAIRNTNDKTRDLAKRIENHRELAGLFAKFSDVCNGFAHSETFPEHADPVIPKEEKNKIPGTWNLYRNIPTNTADLWQESCHLRFLAMLHAAEVDFDQLDQINEYAGQVAEHESLENLYCRMKRVWYTKTLDRVSRFANRANVPCDGRLNEQNAGADVFAKTICDFQAFLKTRFDCENVELLEFFVTVAGKFQSEKIKGLLQQTLIEAEEIAIKRYAAMKNDSTSTQRKINEAAELLELIRLDQGMLRRQNLIGQELQIWGHDIDGDVFDVDSLDGKVVLLDFWATWCAPCVAEFPHLKTLYEKYHTQGFEIVGYNVDADMEQLSAFLEKRPLLWPVLVREKTLEKGEKPLSTFYGAKKLPMIILRDRQGKVVLLDARGKKLEEFLERLFAE